MESHESQFAGRAAPSCNGILETTLYVDNLHEAERFYGNALGLEKIFSVPGRQLVYRCLDSVLLIFNPQITAREQIVINGGIIPLHGSRGAGHAAFRVHRAELDAWREHLGTIGVAIESEVSWPNGAHSIYFRDPSGNSLELATPDIWSGKPG
jgi:catechol 2,3-dioxygenase-like lactoylglutathione lyase family enzyme